MLLGSRHDVLVSQRVVVVRSRPEVPVRGTTSRCRLGCSKVPPGGEQEPLVRVVVSTCDRGAAVYVAVDHCV